MGNTFSSDSANRFLNIRMIPGCLALEFVCVSCHLISIILAHNVLQVLTNLVDLTSWFFQYLVVNYICYYQQLLTCDTVVETYSSGETTFEIWRIALFIFFCATSIIFQNKYNINISEWWLLTNKSSKMSHEVLQVAYRVDWKRIYVSYIY